jgi:hypothetical protein
MFLMTIKAYSIEDPYSIAQESMIPGPMSSIIAAMTQYATADPIAKAW